MRTAILLMSLLLCSCASDPAVPVLQKDLSDQGIDPKSEVGKCVLYMAHNTMMDLRILDPSLKGRGLEKDVTRIVYQTIVTTCMSESRRRGDKPPSEPKIAPPEAPPSTSYLREI